MPRPALGMSAARGQRRARAHPGLHRHTPKRAQRSSHAPMAPCAGARNRRARPLPLPGRLSKSTATPQGAARGDAREHVDCVAALLWHTQRSIVHTARGLRGKPPAAGTHSRHRCGTAARCATHALSCKRLLNTRHLHTCLRRGHASAPARARDAPAAARNQRVPQVMAASVAGLRVANVCVCVCVCV
jgi:hypothetical protein